MTQKVTQQFLYSNVDIDKLEKYLSHPSTLGSWAMLKISYWIRFNRKRFLHFYVLCEHGYNNQRAYITTSLMDGEQILTFIKNEYPLL